MAMRKSRPPTTFKEIVRLMKVNHGIDVHLNTVWNFCLVRSRLEHRVAILTGALGTIKKRINEPKPETNKPKWTFPEL